MLKVIHLFSNDEKIEYFTTTGKINFCVNKRVIALLFLLTAKNDGVAEVLIRNKENDDEEDNHKTVITLKHSQSKESVINFLRKRFLGEDITHIDEKTQKTIAEELELLRYKEAKNRLQQNLYEIWKARVKVVHEFQRQKAENEVKQSVFFRDNYYVRNALKNMNECVHQTNQNRSDFAIFWFSFLRLVVFFKKITLTMKKVKAKMVQAKINARLINLFFLKVRQNTFLNRNNTMNSSKNIFRAFFHIKSNLAKSNEKVVCKKYVHNFFESFVQKNVLSGKLDIFFKKSLLKSEKN